jgi:hypothetical protein
VVVQDLWVEPLAARDRLQLFNQGVLLLSTLFFLGNANALTPREVQSEFNIAISLMDRNPNEAARILQRLYEFSSTIRIQLELARSLYLSGDLAGAKKEFINILNRPIPITVRDKVEWHLSEIQKRQSAKVYIGLYQDSNPGYVTSARTVSIFGQTLSYQPALTTNSETGLALGLEMEREVIPQSGYFVQANINTATYRTDAFNRQNLDFSVTKRWQGYNYKDLRLGHESMIFGGTLLYNYTYAATRWAFNLPNQDYYGFLIKGGPITYPTYTYLSGSQAQSQFFFNHNITRNLTAYFEVGGDNTIASQNAYSSHGFYGALGTQFAEDRSQLQANIKASILQRNYWESDPLWGEVRRDAGQLLFFSLTKRNLYILGLRPSIDVTYQANNSSIPFFTYNKLFGGIFFKNVY